MYQLITGRGIFTKYGTVCSLNKAVKNGGKPDLTIISDHAIRSFIEKCWDKDPRKRPSFNEIVEEDMNNRYKEYFEANEDKAFAYLNLFEKEILDPKFKDIYRIKYLAKKGDVQAMLYYAMLLNEGKEFPVDKKESFKYYKMAADLDNPIACFNIALMLYSGDGIEINTEEGLKYLKKGADLGELNSIFKYAELLEFGIGCEKDCKESARYYKMLADLNVPIGADRYGIMLFHGKGVEQNKKEGIKYFRKGIKLGCLDSYYYYESALFFI